MAFIEDLTEERQTAYRRLRQLADADDLSTKDQREFSALEARIRELDDEIAAKKQLQHDRDNCVPPSYTTNGNHTENVWIDADAPNNTTGFESLGDMLQAIGRDRGTHNFATEPRLRKFASIGGSTGAGGGFAIPQQLVENVLMEGLDIGQTPLLASCEKVTMTSDECMCPRFTDEDHNSTSPFGITWATIDENSSFGTAQALNMAAIKLVAKKVGGYFACSNEWLADSSGYFRSKLAEIFTSSLRWYTEHLAWVGDGAGQPLGILNSDALLAIDKESGQADNTIVLENIVNAWSRLRPGSHSRSFWACNPTVLPQLLTLTLTDGGLGHVVSVLRDGNVQNAPVLSIMGRPLHLVEHLPQLGDEGDLVLVDPRAYIVGNRGMIEVDASPHALHSYDQTAFRCKTRIDGQPALTGTLTPYAGDSVATFVAVAAR